MPLTDKQIDEIQGVANTMGILQKAVEETKVNHVLCMACDLLCKQVVPVTEMRIPIKCKKWNMKPINNGKSIDVDYSNEMTPEDKKDAMLDELHTNDNILKEIAGDYNTFVVMKHLRKKLSTANQRIDSIERRVRFIGKCLERVLNTQKNLSDLVGKLLATDDDKQIDKIMADLSVEDGKQYLLNATGENKEIDNKNTKEDILEKVKENNPHTYNYYKDKNNWTRTDVTCISCAYSAMRGNNRKRGYTTKWVCNNNKCSFFGQDVDQQATKCTFFSYTRVDSYYKNSKEKNERKIMGVDLETNEEKECQE